MNLPQIKQALEHRRRDELKEFDRVGVLYGLIYWANAKMCSNTIDQVHFYMRTYKDANEAKTRLRGYVNQRLRRAQTPAEREFMIWLKQRL